MVTITSMNFTYCAITVSAKDTDVDQLSNQTTFRSHIYGFMNFEMNIKTISSNNIQQGSTV